MFTVKHVEKNGHMSLRTASEVWYDPAVGEQDEYPHGQLLAGNGSGTEHPFRYSSGVVYVMNDKGSTVSRYDLDFGVRS